MVCGRLLELGGNAPKKRDSFSDYVDRLDCCMRRFLLATRADGRRCVVIDVHISYAFRSFYDPRIRLVANINHFAVTIAAVIRFVVWQYSFLDGIRLNLCCVIGGSSSLGTFFNLQLLPFFFRICFRLVDICFEIGDRSAIRTYEVRPMRSVDNDSDALVVPRMGTWCYKKRLARLAYSLAKL